MPEPGDYRNQCPHRPAWIEKRAGEFIRYCPSCGAWWRLDIMPERKAQA